MSEHTPIMFMPGPVCSRCGALTDEDYAKPCAPLLELDSHLLADVQLALEDLLRKHVETDRYWHEKNGKHDRLPYVPRHRIEEFVKTLQQYRDEGHKRYMLEQLKSSRCGGGGPCL